MSSSKPSKVSSMRSMLPVLSLDSLLRVLLIAVVAVLLAGCGGKMHRMLDSDDDGKRDKHGKRGERVVLINTFVVPADKTDEAIAAWEKARDVMREQKGYISTRLHMSLEDDARYRLVNIAKFKSAKHFEAAAKALRESGATNALRNIAGVRGDPNLYTVVRKDKKRRRGWGWW